MSLITPYLYIGGVQEAQDINFLQGKRVHTIVNCAQELPDFFPQNFQYVRLDLDDTPQQSLARVLDPAAAHIIQKMREGKVVFVHCAAGISRSSSVVVYTLMKLHNWNFGKAFRFVRDLHPRANPNPGFVQQLAGHNNPMQREGTPVFVRDIQASTETNVEFIGGHFVGMSARAESLGPPPLQDSDHGTRRESYQAPDGIYDQQGGMTPIQDPSQPDEKRGWSQLTFDCPDCELPEYSAGGGGKGMYARIFS